MDKNIVFPAEWHPQDAIILSWPHEETDWFYMLDEVVDCYVNIAHEILKRQQLVVFCREPQEVESLLEDANLDNLYLVEMDTNDTWIRDYGVISVFNDGQLDAYDFTFNAWGMKFAADWDNQANRFFFRSNIINPKVRYVNKKNFVVEGGGLESDGKGTLLATSECLLSPNRNSYLSKVETEEYLKETFGLDRILWLDFGYLEGDDTDSHIDTLARFCDEHTIAYVQCEDEDDEHYEELKKMEEQLQSFVDYEGNPYRLLALPMADPDYDDEGDRLPATYANFLIMNEAVLLPIYDDKETDEEAIAVLKQAFPNKEIVPINCNALIQQHGSLHCATMQLPKGFLI